MTCIGKIYCRIYRMKSRCVKNERLISGECECRHAVYQCEVEHCRFSKFCGGPGIYSEIIVPRGMTKSFNLLEED